MIAAPPTNSLDHFLPVHDFSESPWPNGRPFALCLTHDVDRIRKTYQYITHLRRPGSIRRLFRSPRGNPYWNFERILEMESRAGVRSTFFFLQESQTFSPFRPSSWVIRLGRYRFDESRIASIISQLDRLGWEIGLHGSIESFGDEMCLAREKRDLDAVLGHPAHGIRQHYLNLSIPETWRRQQAVGFRYDATLGSRTTVGFGRGPAHPFAPFGDSFIVLPLTVMDGALFRVARGWESRLGLLTELVREAERRHALLSILWHQRFLNPYEFPRENALYEAFLRMALERRPWVATAGEIADWWRDRVPENPK